MMMNDMARCCGTNCPLATQCARQLASRDALSSYILPPFQDGSCSEFIPEKQVMIIGKEDEVKQ